MSFWSELFDENNVVDGHKQVKIKYQLMSLPFTLLFLYWGYTWVCADMKRIEDRQAVIKAQEKEQLYQEFKVRFQKENKNDSK